MSILLDYVESRGSTFRGLIIGDSPKYLGVFIGPGAWKIQWSGPISKMGVATGKVIKLGLGLAASIPLYNSLVHSCGAWLASIVKPSKAACLAENKNLQKLTMGPWCGIPSQLVVQLKVHCGFKVEARCLKHASLAGRARTALQTATRFQENAKMIEDARNSMSCVLVPKLKKWINQSIMTGLQEAVDYSHELAPDLCRAERLLFGGLQKQLYQRIHDTDTGESLSQLLARRWKSWLPKHMIRDGNVCNIVSMFKRLNHDFKPSIGCALLKMWLNCLCTTERFQKRGACCPVCGVSEMPDHIKHVLCCEFLSNAAQAFWRVKFQVPRSALALLTIQGKSIDQDFFNAIAVHVFVISKMYYRGRSGSSVDSTMYRAIVTQLCRDCPATRRLINCYVPGRRYITE